MTLCAALGDLLYATSSPQWVLSSTTGAQTLTFSWSVAASGVNSGTLSFLPSGWAQAQTGDQPTDYCSLQGLPCTSSASLSASGKSMPFSLAGMNLSGSLPSSFRTLAPLLASAVSAGSGGTNGPFYLATSIDLSQNPNLVVDMSLFEPMINLTQLSLGGTPLVNGTVPVAALASLTSLTTLSLEASGLVGSLPDVFASLTALNFFKAGSNAIMGSVPPSLLGLPALAFLSLPNNKMGGSLPNFCGATSLTYADLSANAFSGSIPSLGCLSGRLNYLDLKSNRLSGAIPVDLAAAFNCTPVSPGADPYLQMGLSGNILQGGIPTSLLRLTCLKQISVLQPVSVCAAGQYSTGGLSSGVADSFTASGSLAATSGWLTAICAPCPNGSYSTSPGSSACTPCQPGSYSNVNFTECVPCNAGTAMNLTTGLCQPCAGGFYSIAGAVACKLCGANTFSSVDLTSCLSCPSSSASAAGSASLDNCHCANGEVRVAANNSGFVCTPCPVGSFFNVSTLQCQPCLSGTYSTVTAALACTPVDVGFVSECGPAGCTGQAPCPAGSYLNATLLACAPCAPGWFTASSGAVACAPCPVGTIAPSEGASACKACPLNARDAAAHTACVCAPAYFDARFGANTSAPACAACVEGGDCGSDGLLLAQEGWWREAPTETTFLKCRGGFCVAEAPPEASLAAVPSRRRRALEGVGNCAEGHEGVLCAQCVTGWSMQGGQCVSCPASATWTAWTRRSRALLIAFVVPCGLVFICLIFLLPLLPAWERAAGRGSAALGACVSAATGAAARARRAALSCLGMGGPPMEKLITADHSRRLTKRLGSARLEGRTPSGVPAGPRAAHHGDPSAGAFQVAAEALADQRFALSFDAEDGEDENDAGGVDELVETARAFIYTVLAPLKILINFFQITR